jgi:hypothetical protein
LVPSLFGGKVGAGIAVGVEGGSGEPEVIQVFLNKNLMEAGGAVKVESLRIQGLAHSNDAWVGGLVLEKSNAFKFFGRLRCGPCRQALHVGLGTGQGI